MDTKKILAPRVPLIPLRRERLVSTAFPKGSELTKLNSDELKSYAKNVAFRTAIEAIEDTITGKDGNPGIVTGFPIEIYQAWSALPAEKREGNFTTPHSFNSGRTNARKDINKSIDLHNTRNGHKTELEEYRADQIWWANEFLSVLIECNEFAVVHTATKETIDPEALVGMMAAFECKFAKASKKDLEKWEKESK